MLRKILTMLLVILSLSTVSCSHRKIKISDAVVYSLQDRSLGSATCESTLKKCANAVQSQKRVIKEQQDVIDKQSEIIEHAEKEVENAHEDTNKAITGGVSVSTVLLLLLLL